MCGISDNLTHTMVIILNSKPKWYLGLTLKPMSFYATFNHQITRIKTLDILRLKVAYARLKMGSSVVVTLGVIQICSKIVSNGMIREDLNR